MTTLQGRPVISGSAKAEALVARQPFNLLASYSRDLIFHKKKGVIGDKNHPWHGQDATGKVLVIPQTIGSTTGGLVLLEVLRQGIGPAAILCEKADSLLASGGILAEVWYERQVPIIDELPAEKLYEIPQGSTVEVFPDGRVVY